MVGFLNKILQKFDYLLMKRSSFMETISYLTAVHIALEERLGENERAIFDPETNELVIGKEH